MEKVVVFSLKEEKYGVSIEQVREIITREDVTPVPGTPDFFEGFLNVRGELISIINLRRFVGMEEDEMESSRILILSSMNGTTQGIHVDEVASIEQISMEELQKIDNSRDGTGLPEGLLKGVADTESGLVLIIDVERMLSDERQEILEV